MKPTVDMANALQTAFDYLNSMLFSGELPDVMLSFTRNINVIGGYFVDDQWDCENDSDDAVYMLPEIGINVNMMKHNDLVTFYMTMIHEMIHLWQYKRGTEPGDGSHDLEFFDKSDEIGLSVIPVEGDTTGRLVKTQLIEGSPAERALRQLPLEAIIPWQSHELHLPDAPSEQNITIQMKPSGGGHYKPGGQQVIGAPKDNTLYVCPMCGSRVWGKPGKKLICGDDQKYMVEMK